MSGRPREFDDEAVITAAMDVFWTNGYEATSAQELVERTGLGRGSLYNAFGSKIGLYHESLKYYQELGIHIQSNILNGSGTTKERLRTLMLWGIEGDLDPVKRRGCMALFAALERSGKDPIVVQISQVYVKRLEKVLFDLFTEGQHKGEIVKNRSALSLARAFLSSYYGLRLLGRSMPEREFLIDVMEGTLAQL
ncbi:TetR/AcrR family transcriptional regulator [Acinetobacter bereziniae]|uniref:HTH tetR-type domain-containing protein n=1 Tax=Acinetobacter bereziniae NIPH 3 TaxID=1217651 RepID=N8X7A5_ACIBZ|nr:TetR/AcrR family transcriptional regulator [Acinetobacter bereziniae]ENV20071.1 hypothetical protein F963_04120 [Acinetobacter bereziniae NIPH 3]